MGKQGQDWIACDSCGNRGTDGDCQTGAYMTSEMQGATEARVKLEGKFHSTREGRACKTTQDTEACQGYDIE